MTSPQADEPPTQVAPAQIVNGDDDDDDVLQLTFNPDVDSSSALGGGASVLPFQLGGWGGLSDMTSPGSAPVEIPSGTISPAASMFSTASMFSAASHRHKDPTVDSPHCFGPIEPPKITSWPGSTPTSHAPSVFSGESSNGKPRSSVGSRGSHSASYVSATSGKMTPAEVRRKMQAAMHSPSSTNSTGPPPPPHRGMRHPSAIPPPTASGTVGMGAGTLPACQPGRAVLSPHGLSSVDSRAAHSGSSGGSTPNTMSMWESSTSGSERRGSSTLPTPDGRDGPRIERPRIPSRSDILQPDSPPPMPDAPPHSVQHTHAQGIIGTPESTNGGGGASSQPKRSSVKVRTCLSSSDVRNIRRPVGGHRNDAPGRPEPALQPQGHRQPYPTAVQRTPNSNYGRVLAPQGGGAQQQTAIQQYVHLGHSVVGDMMTFSNGGGVPNQIPPSTFPHSGYQQ